MPFGADWPEDVRTVPVAWRFFAAILTFLFGIPEQPCCGEKVWCDAGQSSLADDEGDGKKKGTRTAN